MTKPFPVRQIAPASPSPPGSSAWCQYARPSRPGSNHRDCRRTVLAASTVARGPRRQRAKQPRKPIKWRGTGRACCATPA